MKAEDILIIALCVVAFVMSAYFLLSYEEVGWDSAQYLKVAEYWYTGNQAFKELKWPSTEFKLPAISPLLSFMEYLVFLAFGINIAAVKILYALFLPLLILSVYSLVSALQSKANGLFAAVLTLLNGTVFFWSTRLYTDIPGIAFFVVGLYMLVRNKKCGLKGYALSGLAFGAAFLMRIPLLPSAVIAVGLYLATNRRPSFDMLGLAVAFLLMIPWLVYMATENISIVEAFSGYSTPAISEAKDPVKSIGVFVEDAGLFWVFLIPFGIVSIGNIRDVRVLAFLATLAVFLIMPFSDARYSIPAIVFAAIIIGSTRFENSNLETTVVMIAILALTVVINMPREVSAETESIYCTKASVFKTIGAYIAQNSSSDTIVFSQNYWPEIGLDSKRGTYAMLGERPWLDYLMGLNRVKFIILDNNTTNIKYLENFSFIKAFADNCKSLYLYGR